MIKGFSKRLSSMSKQLAYIHATGAPNSVIVFFLSQKARALVSPTASREGLDLQHQFASIMQEAIFEFDFFSHNIPDVDAALRRSGLKQDRELKILEIGSWEGLSSMFWLWLYPHSQLTAVDTWEGGRNILRTLLSLSSSPLLNFARLRVDSTKTQKVFISVC